MIALTTSPQLVSSSFVDVDVDVGSSSGLHLSWYSNMLTHFRITR